MYKSIGIVAAAFMLTACTSEASEKNEEKPVQTEQTTQNEKEPAKDEAVTQDHEKYDALPEYDTIIEEIGNEAYTFNKKTDNDDKRVFLIEMDGEKQYKTIFVKQTNRLKIVKINGGGEVFNRVIQ